MDPIVAPNPADPRLTAEADAKAAPELASGSPSVMVGAGALRIESFDTSELGPQVTPRGTGFAVYSRHAHRVLLSLFPPDGGPEQVLALPDCRGHVFQGFVPGVGPGWQYGFYAEGPFDPRRGHRFNPKKFLI